MIKIEYEIGKFPTSEKFRIFKLFNTHIWEVMSPEAYNIDTGEIEYLDMVFDDPVTAEIICKYLNENMGELNR